MESAYIQIIKTFEQSLKKSWDQYRTTHNLEDSSSEFIAFLIDRQFIKTTTIRRYAILKEFQSNYSDKKLNKSKVVQLLSDKYLISSRSIWNILREHKGKFRDLENRKSE